MDACRAPTQDELIRLTFTNEHLLAQTVPIFEHMARGEAVAAHMQPVAHAGSTSPISANAADATAVGAVNTKLLSSLVLTILSFFGAPQWPACTSILIAVYNQRPTDCLQMLVPQLYASAIARRPVVQAGGGSSVDKVCRVWPPLPRGLSARHRRAHRVAVVSRP